MRLMRWFRVFSSLSVWRVRSDGGLELGLPLVSVGEEFLCWGWLAEVWIGGCECTLVGELRVWDEELGDGEVWKEQLG